MGGDRIGGGSESRDTGTNLLLNRGWADREVKLSIGAVRPEACQDL